MRHKYIIKMRDNGKTLLIQEFGELEKEIFSLLYEYALDRKSVDKAIAEDASKLVTLLRTPYLYPTKEAALQLAEAVKDLTEAKDASVAEIVVDDKKQLHEETVVDLEEKIEDNGDYEQEEIDDLISDGDVKKPGTTIKVADDLNGKAETD